MKSFNYLLSFVFVCMLAACATAPAPFSFEAIKPPVDLAGRWQLVRGGQATVFTSVPSTKDHYQVSAGTGAGADAADAPTNDVSIRRYQGVPYLLVAEGYPSKGLSVFQVRDLRPGVIRIAALDPHKTAMVLNRRGMKTASTRLWRSEQMYLPGPALKAVLAVPAADVFALDDEMTLTRLP